MNQKTVYQYDRAGRYIGPTMADESPLEPGVWILPAQTTEIAPPPEDQWPPGTWPRWNGSAWEFTGAAKLHAAADPLEKLASFLSANPDVAAMLNTSSTVFPGN